MKKGKICGKCKKEKIKARKKKYYTINRERIIAVGKKYRSENPEKMRIKSKKWRSNNPDKARATVKKWALKNLDVVRDKNARYRARKVNAFIGNVDRQAIFIRDTGKCHICEKRVNPINWHLDHIIPLAKNGMHEPANVAVSHPHCNLQKSDSLNRRLICAQ